MVREDEDTGGEDCSKDGENLSQVKFKVPQTEGRMANQIVQIVTNIFEYSNIFVTNIYSDIHPYNFFYEYIRSPTFVCVKFVCTNIF